jgi:serine/threonine protein kinase
MSHFLLPGINNKKDNNPNSEVVIQNDQASINLPPIARPELLEENILEETRNPQFIPPLPSKLFRTPKIEPTLSSYKEEIEKENWKISPERGMKIINIKKLGEGGQGKTYICTIVGTQNKTEEEIYATLKDKIQNGPFYVVKIFDKLTYKTNDIKKLNEINREIKVLKYIKDNKFCVENTLCYRGEMEDEKNVWIFFDYDGEYTITLDAFIKMIKSKNYSEQEFTNILFTIFFNIYKNIQYIHSMGIAHSDIKPSNILVSRISFKTKLIDFGLSCINDEHMFQIGERIRGNYKNNNQWIKGIITEFNGERNFDIQYDNGDTEKNVSIDKIKQIGKIDVPCDIDIKGTFPYFDIRLFRCMMKKMNNPFCDIRFKKLKTNDLWGLGVIIYDTLFQDMPFEKLNLIRKLNYLKSNDRYRLPPTTYAEPIPNTREYIIWYLTRVQQFYELFYELTPMFDRVKDIVKSASRIYGLAEEEETEETENKKYAENIAKKNVELEKEIEAKADFVISEKAKAREEFKRIIINMKRNFSLINDLFSMFYKKNKIPAIEKMPLIEDLFKPYEHDEEQYGRGRNNTSKVLKSRKNKSRKHISKVFKSKINKSKINKSKINKSKINKSRKHK